MGENGILFSWIGNTDLKAPLESDEVGLGPIAQVLTQRPYKRVCLLSDYSEAKIRGFLDWLRSQTTSEIVFSSIELSSPMAFGQIYEVAVKFIEEQTKSEENCELVFHLSPGTPAMAAVWIILSKTLFPAELIESSKEHGVKTTSVPFNISADFIPDLLRRSDERLATLSEGMPTNLAEFDKIVHCSPLMQRLLFRAYRVAYRSVAVVIEGETGTGKELLARAIHKASPMATGNFVAVNCGAIPDNLIEAELFGYEKGAFTGAQKMHEGYFEAANEGTLFLDEIGELPKNAQVKILRVLQEGVIVRLGSTKPIEIDVRILAATNRSLIRQVKEGNFREDLFFRLAVAVLRLPPLRERIEDIGLLIDHLLDRINEEGKGEPGYTHKKISASAKNLMKSYPWPGNIRELQNTLTRSAIWADADIIDEGDIRESMLSVEGNRDIDILNRPLEDGVNLPELMSFIAKHYLRRAMEETASNKRKAAQLLGLPSYQTLTNWLKKYELE